MDLVSASASRIPASFSPPVIQLTGASPNKFLNSFTWIQYSFIQQLINCIERTLLPAEKVSVFDIVRLLADQHDQVPDFLQVDNGSDAAARTRAKSQARFAMNHEAISS